LEKRKNVLTIARDPKRQNSRRASRTEEILNLTGDFIEKDYKKSLTKDTTKNMASFQFKKKRRTIGKNVRTKKIRQANGRASRPFHRQT